MVNSNNYPQQLKQREEINFRLGIKSSLSRLRSVFGLLYAIYLVENKCDSVQYSIESKSIENISLTIRDELFLSLKKMFQISEAESDVFKDVINNNPLLTSQIESLQMLLETFWRLAKVSFIENPKSNTRERTGGNRFDKLIDFSTNILLIDNSLLELDSTPSVELINLLYSWITEVDNNLNHTPLARRIEKILTILSEETQFKIRTSKHNLDEEVVFQQEGIYENLLKFGEVCSVDSKESVGAFRILKSTTKEGIHTFIKDTKNKFILKKDEDKTEFERYTKMVAVYLDLIPKRTIVYESLEGNEIENSFTINHDFNNKHLPPHQVIYFGSPGTGKSYHIKKITKGKSITRITFHPDSDYYSFVGSYRPTMEGSDIQYKFVPQAFIKAYCKAWLNPDEPHYLVIEEINRGNCSQIFGDIFQCLDRDENGYSEYEVEVSTELAQYIQEQLITLSAQQKDQYNQVTNSKENKFNNICLPPNLYIYATMNTSDQSLFPMDSAFQRRWNWQHIPIDYNDANSFDIYLGNGKKFSWGDFIKAINPKIRELTQSEDKLLGNRFINSYGQIVSFEDFRSKVLFYLWNEVYKDEYQSPDTIFKYRAGLEEISMSYNDLFGDDAVSLVESFLDYNEILLVSISRNANIEINNDSSV